MIRGSLPPQAYTREVLAHAFQWLQTQPESVRKMAHNPDALVALYLKAKKNGEANMEQEAPVSAEAFRHHLKTLAHEIQQFLPESEQAKPTQPNPVAQAPVSSYQAPPSMPTQMHSLQHNLSNEQFIESGMGRRPTQSINHRNTDEQSLDSRSLEMIHKVKNHLNLSSDTEALRALVVLGFERFQSLFRSNS